MDDQENTSQQQLPATQQDQQGQDSAGHGSLYAASAEVYPLDNFEWEAMTFADLSGMLVFVALMANLGALCVQTLLRSLEWL